MDVPPDSTAQAVESGSKTKPRFCLAAMNNSMDGIIQKILQGMPEQIFCYNAPFFAARRDMADIWIKICGIARAEDARVAVDLGADALGLVCYPPSPRHVPPARFGEVLEPVAGEVEVFALFVNPASAEVRAAAASGLFSGLQFHGDEPAGFCESFGLPYMKALRVRGDSDLRRQVADFASARRILLDTWDASNYGGTGKSFRWEMAGELAAAGVDNIVVAGGLRPGNVAAAIRRARPCGIDASSGVEAAPGAKDLNKLREFMKEARSA